MGGDSVLVAQLRAAGLERNETVLGYRIAATREIVVNPPRATELVFAAGDEVLVLPCDRTRFASGRAIGCEPRSRRARRSIERGPDLRLRHHALRTSTERGD